MCNKVGKVSTKKKTRAIWGIYTKGEQCGIRPSGHGKITKRDKREAYRRFENERHDGPRPRNRVKQLIYAAGREVA